MFQLQEGVMDGCQSCFVTQATDESGEAIPMLFENEYKYSILKQYYIRQNIANDWAEQKATCV